MSVMRSIENRTRKIISGAEIDDTIFTDFREGLPNTISCSSIVRSLLKMHLGENATQNTCGRS
jgi:hypothetical protein